MSNTNKPVVLFAVLLSSLLLLSGCVSAYRKKCNIANIQAAGSFQAYAKPRCVEGNMTITYAKNGIVKSDKLHSDLFPYDTIFCTVTLPNLPPNGHYTFYCPNTGCPFQPEFTILVHTDSKGNPSYTVQENEPIFPGPLTLNLSLWGIPGFCSDWYLLAQNGTPLYSTSFTYQPIIAQDEQGRTLTLKKRDCGGNYLDICFSGFQPNEKIVWSRTSCDETIVDAIYADPTGSRVIEIMPQTNQAVSKGSVKIAVLFDTSSLESTTEWDSKTLFVRSRQTSSGLTMCATIMKRLRSSQ